VLKLFHSSYYKLSLSLNSYSIAVEPKLKEENIMKKIIAILLVTIMIGGLVLAAGNGAGAGGGNGQGNGDQQQQQIQEFVDEDGDGVCDNAGTGNGPGDGDGTCDETPETPQDGTGNQYGRNK